MKKTILFALIAILFLTLFTGCRAYRGSYSTMPGYEVTDIGGRPTRGFHYRSDGYVSTDRVTRGHHRGGHVTRGHHDGHHGGHHARHNFRHDGLVTDTDGRIGNGTFADRPIDRDGAVRWGVSGVDNTRNFHGHMGAGAGHAATYGQIR